MAGFHGHLSMEPALFLPKTFDELPDKKPIFDAKSWRITALIYKIRKQNERNKGAKPLLYGRFCDEQERSRTFFKTYLNKFKKRIDPRGGTKTKLRPYKKRSNRR